MGSNTPRRVVVGHDTQGKAVLIADGLPEVNVLNPASGFVWSQVWTTDATPALLVQGPQVQTDKPSFCPPPLGSTFRVIEFPPEGPEVARLDRQAARSAFAALGAPHVSTFEPDGPHPLMHRTESLDYGVVLDGAITMVLDDSVVELQAGDVVVHLGTNHAWSNRSGRPCRMAFVLIDGHYDAALRGQWDKATD